MGVSEYAMLVYGIDIGPEDIGARMFDPDDPDDTDVEEHISTTISTDGVRIENYGDFRSPGRIICMPAKRTYERGCSPVTTEVHPSWDHKILEFASRIGIDTRGKTPGWHIAVYGGGCEEVE